MGNSIFPKPADSTQFHGPMIRMPFSSGVSSVGFWAGTDCEDFELNVLDCFEAHGPVQGQQACKLYWQDYKECTHKFKQLERVEIMRRERKKQWLKGYVGQGPEVPYTTGCPDHSSFAPESFNDEK